MTVLRADRRGLAPLWSPPAAPPQAPAWDVLVGGAPEALADLAGVSALYEPLKRILDVVIASVLIVLLAPLMGAVALAIKLTSPGVVVFRQIRAGRGGQPFIMYKFRSMRLGAESDRPSISHLNQMQGSPVFKIAQHPRMTRLGRWLRRTSIDELPQLFNVLAGHMSLVGPRPLWMPEAQQAGLVSAMRTAVKPGLTCLWQISGRSELTYDQWVNLDLYYIQQRSTWLDLLIMCQTVPAVLSAKGAY